MSEAKRIYLLKHLAQDIIFGTLDNNRMSDIKHCSMPKEIWDYLADVCKESDQITRDKLQICVEKYESFPMIPGEIVQQMEARFNEIVSELSALGRDYLVAELNAKMPREDWFVKVTTLEERHCSKFPTKDVFDSLRAHEFDFNRMKETETKLVSSLASQLEDAALFAKKTSDKGNDTQLKHLLLPRQKNQTLLHCRNWKNK